VEQKKRPEYFASSNLPSQPSTSIIHHHLTRNQTARVMALAQRIDGIDKSIEELDKKLEATQKAMEDDILEFARRMDARWNELRQSL